MDEPTQRLPDDVAGMWTLEALGLGAGPLVLALSAGVATPWLPLGVAVLVVAYAVLQPIRARRYRWELREDELDLQHGAWRRTRTSIPVTRIQHVSLERTGWTDMWDVVRVRVHTAAGTTKVPGLQRAVGEDLRDRVLLKLRTPDDL